MHLSAGGSQLVIVSRVVHHLDGLEHAEIFDFLFSDSWAIVGDEDQLGRALSDAFLDGAIPEIGLSRLEHEGKFLIDRL